MALLAKESCCHPFPWWHDPRRHCVILPGESPSVLAQLPIPRAETPDVEVVKTGPRLDIIVPPETCSRLHALLTAAPDYFALLTGVAPQARARLYWEPGQTAPSATISASAMPQADQEDLDVAGNFLMLVHGEVADEAQQREDESVVIMAEPTWRAFTAAVAAQQPFTCHTGGESISQVSLQLKKRRYTSAFGEL